MGWTQWVFAASSLISLPLYLLTITVCINEWKHNQRQRTFYLLIISQGFVDIIVVLNYFIFSTLRAQLILKDFYWSLQDTYFPTWCFLHIYISVIMRCFGVLLITFHRYLSMCRNHTSIEQFVNVSHRWTIPIIQLTVPLIYSIPLFQINDVVFLSRDTLEVLAKHEQITLVTSMTTLFVSITFTLCSAFYGALLKFLINNRYSNSVAIKRECRLYVQMLGLFIAFGLLLVYNILLMILSFHRNVSYVLLNNSGENAIAVKLTQMTTDLKRFQINK
ncbi:hypothetical protein DICVIV_06694 [Dictyocaulus viviparus]|uniref:G-protein coupled receptors family 1 profile domain-containing protein n=1 Tax=Dictyocaulus viviparus TaxID=29172 RepID=A0A0D8XRV6_DICVI|nr:hypothetical protein DICVIV_06694 [Dictyocaulus viviparus]